MLAAGGSQSLCLTHSCCIGNVSKFLTLKVTTLTLKYLFQYLPTFCKFLLFDHSERWPCFDESFPALVKVKRRWLLERFW